MKFAQNKVGLNEPKPIQPKTEHNFRISGIMFFVILLLIGGSITFTVIQGISTFNAWKGSWDAVIFAKEHPELIRPIKERYNIAVQVAIEEVITPAASASPSATPTPIASPKVTSPIR